MENVLKHSLRKIKKDKKKSLHMHIKYSHIMETPYFFSLK